MPVIALGGVVGVVLLAYGYLLGGSMARWRAAWLGYRLSVRTFRRSRRAAGRRLGDMVKVTVIPILMIAFAVWVLMIGKGR